MSEKLKYVRLKEYNSIIIFPYIVNHSEFRHFNPVSAGFCNVNISKKRVDCYGRSIGLELDSNPKEDTISATQQVFGIEAMLNVINN